MLRIIYTNQVPLRDALVSQLKLEREEVETENEIITYKKSWWILVYNPNTRLDMILPTLLENWNPDIIYSPYLWRSIDMIHEIGDIILPNVFLSYDPKIATLDTAKIDTSLLNITSRFLTQYSEQKDYYVEDYGLSIGGIVVDGAPPDSELNTALMTTYEADIYIKESLDAAYAVASSDEVPSVILLGVLEWKVGVSSDTPIQQIARNMITTIRLMEEIE